MLKSVEVCTAEIIAIFDQSFQCLVFQALEVKEVEVEVQVSYLQKKQTMKKLPFHQVKKRFHFKDNIVASASF